jgi:hypothetical protein
MKVLVDTNFAIDLFRLKLLKEFYELEVEIGKFEVITLDQILNELKRISRSKRREAKFAKIAASWLLEQKIVTSKLRGVDRAILAIVNKNTIVATNDKKLRKKLKAKGIRTIYIRGKKYLRIG